MLFRSGYCMTVATVTHGAKKIFDGVSTDCKDDDSLRCCWKHNSRYLCSQHACRYAVNGNSSFTLPSASVYRAAYNSSNCKNLERTGGHGTGCETDDGDNTFDGAACLEYYWYLGTSDGEIKALNTLNGWNVNYTVNGGVDVRCVTTAGRAN